MNYEVEAGLNHRCIFEQFVFVVETTEILLLSVLRSFIEHGFHGFHGYLLREKAFLTSV